MYKHHCKVVFPNRVMLFCHETLGVLAQHLVSKHGKTITGAVLEIQRRQQPKKRNHK